MYISFWNSCKPEIGVCLHVTVSEVVFIASKSIMVGKNQIFCTIGTLILYNEVL